MHALSKVEGNEGDALVPPDEDIIFSTDNPITVGDNNTVYYDRDPAHNPRVILTRKTIYFLSKQSENHNLCTDIINIESYKAGAPQKNSMTVEITLTSSEKNTSLNNNLVTAVCNQLIKITFTTVSKKHQADSRSIKEDHDLLLATLTGLLEARKMSISAMNSKPVEQQHEKMLTQQQEPTLHIVEDVKDSDGTPPKIICDDQEVQSVLKIGDHSAFSNNDVLSKAIFAPREHSVFKHGDKQDNQSPEPEKATESPILAQPVHAFLPISAHDAKLEPDQSTLLSTLIQEDYLRELSRPLTFDQLRKPSALLAAVNKLMFLCLKACNENAQMSTPVALSILEKKVDNPNSAEAGSLQTLLPSAEEFFSNNDYNNSLEETLGLPHITNNALIELRGKSPAYIMSSYIDSYTSSYNSLTPIEALELPLDSYTYGLQNVNVASCLSSYFITPDVIVRNLSTLLLNYTLTSPFHSSAKFKLVPADEVFSLLNHARPMYPVSVETFYKAIRLADDECKSRINEKAPYHRFPIFVPWKINNTWYFVQKALRLTNVIHFIIVNVLYNAWTKVRIENPHPNKPHAYVTADELASRFGLTHAVSMDILDFMVKQRLLVVDVCTSKHYYLNLITKHYRCLQDTASKISKITA